MSEATEILDMLKMVEEIDEDALEELKLFMKNDGKIYRQKKDIIKNIKTKIKRGTYDASKAPKLWMYWVDVGAKRYMEDNGSPGDKWYELFPKKLRMELAKQFAEEYFEMIQGGEYD